MTIPSAGEITDELPHRGDGKSDARGLPCVVMQERRRTNRIAVFTSVDGTLLDSRTFDAGSNAPLVARLRDDGVPVIPVSVMTLDEIAPVADAFGFRDLMAIEAGGAIARWNGGGWDVEPCGPPADQLLDVIAEIEDRSGANLLVYSALPQRDAALVSGRDGAMLDASTHRCYSEPFLIESGDPEKVRRAASRLGFSICRGGRFLYLCRECDEGSAFARIREEVQCGVAVALGGSMVDAGFLQRADVAIVVPGPDGPDPELLSRVPHARIAPAPAPDGWAAAVEEVCEPAFTRRSLRATRPR